MTDGQKKTLAILLPRYTIPQDAGVFSFEKIFHRISPIFLEIGFGTGTALIEMAQEKPDCDFIGVEVFASGAQKALSAIHNQSLSNVRILLADAVEILDRYMPPKSLDGVFIFFPDPWPKTRHHKRRLINPVFLDLLQAKMKTGAIIYLATDWKPYAEWMMEALSKASGFENMAGIGQYAPRPTFRPLTKFEKRGNRLGHNTWDLKFKVR